MDQDQEEFCCSLLMLGTTYFKKLLIESVLFPISKYWSIFHGLNHGPILWFLGINSILVYLHKPSRLVATDHIRTHWFPEEGANI